MNPSKNESTYNKEDNSRHSLLEPTSPSYSDTTIRRAFIVWLRCGQRNRFSHVCKFYHHLETLEATMSPSMRASSRQHEFSLFRNDPPTSPYLEHIFPNLYTRNLDQHIQEVRDEEDKAILREFERRQEEASKVEIIKASTLIRNYCLTYKKSLADFLYEFKEHTRRCCLVHNVFNVMFYIRRKSIDYELKNVADNGINCTEKALAVDAHSSNVNTKDKEKKHDESKQIPNINEGVKKIKILTNESRKNVTSEEINNK